MLPLYLKLADTQNEFFDEALQFHLIRPNVIASSVDYNNLTNNIIGAIKSGVLIQISEATYRQLTGGISDPLIINPSHLISVQQFINTLNTGTVFFVYDGGKWYKTTWSKIASSIMYSGNNLSTLSFRVTTNNPPELPKPGDSFFTNSFFSDLPSTGVLVFINNIQITPSDLLSSFERTQEDHYSIDGLNQKFLKAISFQENDVVVIKKI